MLEGCQNKARGLGSVKY